MASAVCVAAAACSPSRQGPPAQSPDRQSDAEYDVASDLFHKGNPRAALDHVRKSLSLNEENDRAYYLKAAVLLVFCSGPRGMQDPDCKLGEAEQSARAALRHNPDFRDARNLLGQVLINEGKLKEAILVLEPLTKDPAYVHPYFAWGNFGWAQVLDGQLEAGIASLNNAVAEPRFCVGHYRLGVAWERRGDMMRAEESLTRGLSVDDPQCMALQDAWEARARVRVRLGKTAEARSDYEKCVEISKETATGTTCAGKLRELPATADAPRSSGTPLLDSRVSFTPEADAIQAHHARLP